MIVTASNGRRRSVRTGGEDIRAFKEGYALCTPEERSLIQALLNEGDPNSAAVLSVELNESLYRRPLVSMQQFIEDPYYLGDSMGTMYPELKKDVIALFEAPYREVVLCLHPDTPIPLLNGMMPTLRSLAEKWAQDKQDFWIYGVNPDGHVRPALATEPRCTGEDDYYRVTLDDGSFFVSNARHRMVMRDGGKRQVMDMVAGDSLMPFETVMSTKGRGRRIAGYEMVMDFVDEEMRYTHALVADHVHGSVDPSKVTIHHVDFDKRNNEPDNLSLMPWSDHQLLHARTRREWLAVDSESRTALAERQRAICKDPHSPLRMAHAEFMASPEGRALSANNLAKAIITMDDRRERGGRASVCRWNGPDGEEHRAAASERMRVRNLSGNAAEAGRLSFSNRSPEAQERQRQRALLNSMRQRRDDVNPSTIREAIDSGSSTFKAVAKKLGCSPWRVRCAIVEAGLSLREFFPRTRNHYVVSVEPCGRGPVYCMTVPDTENFAIATNRLDGTVARSGVFSSNTGSIGSGKTFLASAAICRILYELSCMKNPQLTFGMSPGTEMVIMLISKNLVLAREVMKTSIDDKLKLSPYFMQHFTPKFSTDYTLFPNSIRMNIGSYGAERALGANIFSAFLDECLGKKSLLSIGGHGKSAQFPVGDLWAMGPAGRDGLLVEALDHATGQQTWTPFRMRLSTVQPLVRIETNLGSCVRAIEPSREHPLLVRRDEWLIYVPAREIVVGDEVVWRRDDGEEGRDVERGSATEVVGGREAADRGTQSILGEDAQRGDQGAVCGERTKADDGGQAQRGDQGQAVGCVKGARDVSGDASQDGGIGQGALHAGVAGADVGADHGGSSERACDEHAPCVSGRARSSEPWTEADGGTAAADARSVPGSPWTCAQRGIAGQDLGGECAGDQRSSAVLPLPCVVAGWRLGALPDGEREAPGSTAVHGKRCGAHCRRRSDGVDALRVGWKEKDDDWRLLSDKERWRASISGGERFGTSLSRQGTCALGSRMEVVPGEWALDDPCGERSAHSECMDGTVCDGGVHGERAETSRALSHHVDGRSLGGCRSECLRVADLSDAYQLVRVTATRDLPAEQTYSIETDCQTFVADGCVVHNTNFPPKRSAQQINQTFGKQLTAANFDIVEKVYRSMVRRIKSRFQTAGGDFPGMVIMVSSAATLDSFTERKLREAKLDPTVFVRDHTAWTSKPMDHFCGKWFYVLCSKSSLRSRILEDGEYDEISPEYLEENNAWLIEVPVEYKEDFESNLEDSLRDIAGVSTQAISAFFQRVDAIDACIAKDRKHPFSSEVWISGSPATFDWDYLCRKIERRLPGGFVETAWAPKEEPSSPRWIHIDTSISGDCVTADTLVATPAGNVRIDSIVAGTPVYSLGSDGKFTVATATNPGLKRKGSPLVRVVTDGGSVRCTPDHKFMLRDGTYREARCLRDGDSLMPLYRRCSAKQRGRRGGGGYEEFYQPASGRYEATHRAVAEYKIGRPLTVDECVHHVGTLNPDNKLDNRPENLSVMTKRDHWRLHQTLIVAYNKSERHRAWAREWGIWSCTHPTLAMVEARRRNGRARCQLINAGESNPSKLEKNRKRFGDMVRERHERGLYAENYKHFNSPEVREKSRASVSVANRRRQWSDESRRKLSMRRQEYLDKIAAGEIERNSVSAETRAKMAAAHRGRTWTEATRVKFMASLKPQEWTEESRVKIADANRNRVWSEESRQKCADAQRRRHEKKQAIKNHKVLRVEDAGHEDVYCLTVDGAHNFVVVFGEERFSSGIVIHNSTGFVMGRISRWVEVVRRDGEGHAYTDTAPYYVIEAMLCIRPPSGDQIYMPDLRRLVYELQAHGFPIHGFSSDSFQYVEMHQQIRRHGIHTELISMDRTIDPFEELKSAIYEKRIEFYEYTPLLQELRSLEYDRVKGKIDHPRHCFTGETRIALADGMCPTFKELSQRTEPFYVYSIGDEGVCIARAEDAHVTMVAEDLVEVMLDNYQVARCTPDHLFMTLDREWVQAQNLTPDVRLMPLYRAKAAKGGTLDYERVWCPIRRERFLTHRLAAGLPHSGTVVHHIDGNKTNNDPRNLEVMERGAHYSHHAADLWDRRRAALREGHRRYVDERGRRISSETMRRAWEEGKFGPPLRACSIEGCVQLASARGLCDVHYQRARRAGALPEKMEKMGENHRVLRVTRVPANEEVYDLSVPGLENFALASGVFVHNSSKDVSDALAGVVWGLRQQAARLPWAADADTPRVAVGHDHGWVSDMIPAEDVDLDEVRAARSAQSAHVLMPFFIGDD